MSCEYCGGTQPVEVPASEVVEYAIERAFEAGKTQAVDRPVQRVRCEHCGAVADFEPSALSGRCAFCGTPGVVSLDVAASVWRPESVLPFLVSKDQAVSAYQQWLRTLWFRPNDLKARAQLRDIQGVYLPFWTFDAHASCWWTAEAGYHYWVTESYTDSQGQRQTRQVQHTRWQHAHGQHAQDFDDLLVYASRGLPRALCEKIEPFPTEALVPYDARYLLGFGAEKYAIDPKEGWLLAQTRMQRLLEQACAAQVPGDTHRNLNVRTAYSHARFKHVLLPIWVAAYRYGKDSHRFLVNGQTGEVQGTAPWSWVKILLALVIAALLLGALLSLRQ